MLASLRGRGLIEFDERARRYLPGPAVMALGLRCLAGLDVRQLALPELREVIMPVSVGVPYPLHAGASSKAFLAFCPAEQIESYLRSALTALTEHTITDPRRFSTTGDSRSPCSACAGRPSGSRDTRPNAPRSCWR